MPKILPPAVVAELARNFRPSKRKKKSATTLTPEARKFFQEQGRRGGLSASKKQRSEWSKKGGESRMRKVCRKLGIDYDKLPDAPAEQSPVKQQQ